MLNTITLTQSLKSIYRNKIKYLSKIFSVLACANCPHGWVSYMRSCYGFFQHPTPGVSWYDAAVSINGNGNSQT